MMILSRLVNLEKIKTKRINVLKIEQIFIKYKHFLKSIIFSQVDQEEDSQLSCKDAYSYCGSKDKLFPDRRSMGFPFDRMPREGVHTLQQFLTPNMKVGDFKIVFTDRVILRDEE